jgi:protein tyrosine phosphatase (PTP) superfamily phosphohydrolase (DUF442 family)
MDIKMQNVGGWRRRAAAFAVLFFAIAAVPAGWAGYLRVTGNIHEVVPGEVYRSAQLSASQLSSFIREKQIRTVINLRGASPGRRWYDDEINATTLAGARHVDLRMSADKDPSSELVASLIRILESAPRPFLIHCEGGADRSGLAAALYELRIDRRPAEIAASQLSFSYGHFPWLWSQTGAMDRTFWRVVDAGFRVKAAE